MYNTLLGKRSSDIEAYALLGNFGPMYRVGLPTTFVLPPNMSCCCSLIGCGCTRSQGYHLGLWASEGLTRTVILYHKAVTWAMPSGSSRYASDISYWSGGYPSRHFKCLWLAWVPRYSSALPIDVVTSMWLGSVCYRMLARSACHIQASAEIYMALLSPPDWNI